MKIDEQIVNFCTAVKGGFGTISDSTVRLEFERINETKIETEDLGKLLALLERYELLDKKSSVNKEDQFYQFMYKKMTENNANV
jgi:hypothetical protein